MTPPRHPLRGWVVDSLLAIIITALLLGWSFHAGRLALPPQYDDVAYLRQALQWVTILQQDGLRTLLNIYWQKPAHAPLHDAAGAASFLLFGIHDWAPYAGRVIIVLLFLRIGRRLLAGLAPHLRWGMIAVAFTTPFVQTLVTEFRPDPIYGLLLATAMLFVLIRPLADSTWRRCALAGVLFAAVLLIKTSTYPQTLAFMLGVLFLRIVADRIESRRITPALARAAAIVCLAILIPLPHYLLAWKPIHYYIEITLFGERRDLWRLAGNASDHLLYYLTGRGGQVQLGLRLWVFLAAAIIGAFVAWRTVPRRRATIAIVLLTLVVAYALPTLNLTKSLFLGMTFHFMLLLSALWLIARAVTLAGDALTYRRRREIVLALGVCSLVLWSPRVPIAGEASGDLPERHRIAGQLYEAIRPHLHSDPPPRIMLTATGVLINPDLFAYWALKRDGRWIDFEQNIFADDLDVHRAALRRADVVIAGERHNGEAYSEYASTKAQHRTLDLARAAPDLLPVASVLAHRGNAYHVFLRATRLPGELFTGFDDAEGLSTPVGPFPQHRLPVMRSGTGASTTLRFHNPGERPVLLLIDAMSLPPARTLRLRLNGLDLPETLTFDVPQQFRSFRGDLPASPGTNELIITYSPPAASEEKVVHYRRLQLIPRPPIRRFE